MAAKSSTRKKKSPALPKPESLSYEQATEELEAILESIESGSIELEEAMTQWKRGTQLIQRCRSILDNAEQQLKEVAAGQLDDDADDE